MKITKVYEKFKDSAPLFKCPVCQSAVAFQNEASLVCQSRHTFDLSKAGYINLLQKQVKTLYSKALFESRRRIFTAGFYDQLTAALAEIIAAYAPEGVINVLDAGCGEGFFTTQLSGGSKAARNVFAVDIEKEAVKLAARFATGAKCFVADLAQLPLQTGTMDVVINVFSPARYEEFGRVLKRGGLIVKVVPQAFYLAELRDVVKGQLAKGAYSNADVLALFEKNLDVLAVRRVRYTLPVTSEQVADFAGMTPMLFHLDSEQVNLGAVSEMTIDVDVLVGRFGV